MASWFDDSLVGGPTELSVISLTAINRYGKAHRTTSAEKKLTW